MPLSLPSLELLYWVACVTSPSPLHPTDLELLTADDLAAFRGERLVFAHLGFSVAPGGALLLAGPNGSGKSTLLRVLAGLARAEAGSLLWNGQDALADRVEHARRVAYVGHLDAIKPGLTVLENLAAPATVARSALARLGMAELAEMPARMLSAGQRRRVALSRLALSAAPLWLLDEPTLGVDAASVESLGVLLAKHRAGDGIVIAATHLPLPLPEAATLTLTPA